MSETARTESACRVSCDACGREARRPAINLAVRVFCTRCAPDFGMDPGEHNRDVRPYDEWKRLAAERQAT
jgi:hypothetical protein